MWLSEEKGKNQKNVWWNYELKAAVKRKEVFGGRDEVTKERFMAIYKEEKRKVKRFMYQSKKDVIEQCGKMNNQDVVGTGRGCSTKDFKRLF